MSFVACTCDRTKLFTDAETVQVMVGYLGRAAEEFGCLVAIYCFMPDHLHVMLQGLSDESNALHAMSKFKVLSGKWMHRQGLPGWPGNFYDHIVRAGEGWRQHAQYIAMNPVRAHLVKEMLDYPLTGSIGCELSDALFPW